MLRYRAWLLRWADMGGPESRAFPPAPANVDTSKPYADGDATAMAEQREHIVRQKLVKVETAKVRARACCGDATMPAALLRRRSHTRAVATRAGAAVLPRGGREPLPELP